MKKQKLFLFSLLCLALISSPFVALCEEESAPFDLASFIGQFYRGMSSNEITELLGPPNVTTDIGLSYIGNPEPNMKFSFHMNHDRLNLLFIDWWSWQPNSEDAQFSGYLAFQKSIADALGRKPDTDYPLDSYDSRRAGATYHNECSWDVGRKRTKLLIILRGTEKDGYEQMHCIVYRFEPFHPEGFEPPARNLFKRLGDWFLGF